MKNSAKGISRNLLSLLFIVSFLPFLRLGMWGGGVENLAAGDIVSVSKMLVRVVVIFFVAIFFMKHFRQLNDLLKGPSLSLIIFYLFGFLSLLYSSDIFYSTFRLAEHVSLFFLTLFLGLHWSNRLQSNELLIAKAINLMIFGLSTIVITVCIFVVIGSADVWRHMIGDSVGLGGLVIHVHTLAITCALLYGMLLGKLSSASNSSKIGLLLACVVLLVMIGFTLSRTGYLLVFLVTTIVLIQHKKLVTAVAVCFFGLLVTMLFVDIDLSIPLEIAARGQNFQELISLSSRVTFWSELVVDTTFQRPIFGFGYQMLSEDGTTKIFSSLGGIARGNAHNTFVQTYAGLGIIGVSLLSWNIGSVFYRTSYLSRYGYLTKIDKDKLFVIVITCLVGSLTQYGIVGMTTPLVPIYGFCVALLSVIQINSFKQNRKINFGRVLLD